MHKKVTVPHLSRTVPMFQWVHNQMNVVIVPLEIVPLTNLSTSIDIQSRKTRKETFLSKYCSQDIAKQFLRKLTHSFRTSVYVFLHQSSSRYFLWFSFAYKYNEEGRGRGGGLGQGYFRDAVIDHFWCPWVVIYWKTVLWIVIVVYTSRNMNCQSSRLFTRTLRINWRK